MAPTSLWRGPEWNGLPILCTEHLCLPGINKRHAFWYQEIKVQRDRESCTSHTPLWKCLSFHLNQEHHPLCPLPHPGSCISGPWIFSVGIECLPGERRASDQLQEAWPSRTARGWPQRSGAPAGSFWCTATAWSRVPEGIVRSFSCSLSSQTYNFYFADASSLLGSFFLIPGIDYFFIMDESSRSMFWNKMNKIDSEELVKASLTHPPMTLCVPQISHIQTKPSTEDSPLPTSPQSIISR